VKKRAGQNMTLTPQTIIVVSTAAYFAFLKDIKSTPTIAAIIKSSGTEETKGRPAMNREISATPEDIAPIKQIKLRMRVSNDSSSETKYLMMNCFSFFIINAMCQLYTNRP